MAFKAKILQNNFVIVHWSLIKTALFIDTQEHRLLLSALASFQIRFYVA